MKFAVFTHVIHGIKNGRFYAYSPYIREMNLWLKYVDEVEIVAALEEESNKEGEISPQGEYYKHSNITFTEISSFHLLNFLAVLDALLKIPFIFFRILGAMHRADHLHIRCPGNIGLLAAIAQIFFPKKPKTVKYAGNWDPKATQPITYKLQKKILGNTFLTRNTKVLIYGDWPQQSDNIFPFFTASFSEKEKELIKKDFKPPYKFIFSGNLVEGKGVDKAIEFIKILRTNNLDCRLEIYGDGILENDLRELVENENLKKHVHFKGRVDLANLKEAYRDAHFTLLLSKSEGWPKAIAEGMWYGCIPIATSVSCVPWMLNYGERGVIISDIDQRIKNREKREERRDDKENFLSKQLPDKFHRGRQFECSDESRDVSRIGFSEKDLSEILSLITNLEKLKQMSIAAQKWSQQYTLERFERAIRGILGKRNPQPSTHNLKSGTENSQSTADTKQQTSNNKLHLQLTTDNPQLTTDNPKQQTPNYKQLRVLQLTDTLNPGGAERMAVNLANSLKLEVEASYICCTRQEGMLKRELKNGVGYLFLNKKHSLDLRAFLKLKSFVKKEQIELVHAHGTSWFWAALLKLSGLKIKLVWHDHYGESEHLEQRNIRILKPLSRYFDGIISVNEALKNWAQVKLKSQTVVQLNNFICVSDRSNTDSSLKGSSTDFKIVCVANLRPQKDHLNLLAAFEKISIKGVSLHLIGADPGTAYSKMLRKEILNFTKPIYYYGSITEVAGLLHQAHLGVLSSSSEGLPLALLEYAFAGLPVVYTNVGQCKEVMAENALGVPAKNADALAAAIERYYSNNEFGEQDARCLQKRIKKLYSKEEVLPLFLKFYNNLIKDNGRHK